MEVLSVKQVVYNKKMHKIQTYGTAKVIPTFSYYMLQPTFES